MTDYFVRHKTQWGTVTTCAMWFDQGEAPSKSLERGNLVTKEVVITDELKKEYEGYLEEHSRTGMGFYISQPGEHFPFNFFEWLQNKYPE